MKLRLKRVGDFVFPLFFWWPGTLCIFAAASIFMWQVFGWLGTGLWTPFPVFESLLLLGIDVTTPIAEMELGWVAKKLEFFALRPAAMYWLYAGMGFFALGTFIDRAITGRLRQRSVTPP